MLTRLKTRLTYANIVATLALFVALGGSSYAAVKLGRNAVKSFNIAPNAVTSTKIRNGSITAADFSSTAKSTLVGPTGATGPQGPAGPAGPAGDARAYGFVDNSSGTPSMGKAKGGVTVRRSGNGTFCITAPGIDPTSTPIVVTQDAKSGEVALILVGSGLAFSQQCTSSEFQVLTISPLNFNIGVNDASFEFVIP